MNHFAMMKFRFILVFARVAVGIVLFFGTVIVSAEEEKWEITTENDLIRYLAFHSFTGVVDNLPQNPQNRLSDLRPFQLDTKTAEMAMVEEFMRKEPRLPFAYTYADPITEQNSDVVEPSSFLLKGKDKFANKLYVVTYVYERPEIFYGGGVPRLYFSEVDSTQNTIKTMGWVELTGQDLFVNGKLKPYDPEETAKNVKQHLNQLEPPLLQSITSGELPSAALAQEREIWKIEYVLEKEDGSKIVVFRDDYFQFSVIEQVKGGWRRHAVTDTKRLRNGGTTEIFLMNGDKIKVPSPVRRESPFYQPHKEAEQEMESLTGVMIDGKTTPLSESEKIAQYLGFSMSRTPEISESDPNSREEESKPQSQKPESPEVTTEVLVDKDKRTLTIDGQKYRVQNILKFDGKKLGENEDQNTLKDDQEGNTEPEYITLLFQDGGVEPKLKVFRGKAGQMTEVKFDPEKVSHSFQGADRIIFPDTSELVIALGQPFEVVVYRSGRSIDLIGGQAILVPKDGDTNRANSQNWLVGQDQPMNPPKEKGEIDIVKILGPSAITELSAGSSSDEKKIGYKASEIFEDLTRSPNDKPLPVCP